MDLPLTPNEVAFVEGYPTYMVPLDHKYMENRLIGYN